jgi:hypothetical protein
MSAIGARGAGTALCGDPRGPDVSLQTLTDAGWRELAAGLIARGLAVVATGGPGEGDRLDAIWADLQVTRLDGALSWPELAVLIRGASVYVGPDTSVTHLAAATGVPTVALYGPDRSAVVGTVARPAASIPRGMRPAPSRRAGMSGWCRIRCPASRASWRAACAASTATASAWTNCRRNGFSMRSMPRLPAGRA